MFLPLEGIEKLKQKELEGETPGPDQRARQTFHSSSSVHINLQSTEYDQFFLYFASVISSSFSFVQSVLLTQRKTVFTPCLQDLSYKQNLPERLLTSSDKA